MGSNSYFGVTSNAPLIHNETKIYVAICVSNNILTLIKLKQHFPNSRKKSIQNPIPAIYLFLRKKVDIILFIYELIKFLLPINIHSFVFDPYKLKSHFLVPVTFSLSILGTKTVDGNF